jgi:hypothetical protein
MMGIRQAICANPQGICIRDEPLVIRLGSNFIQSEIIARCRDDQIGAYHRLSADWL